MTRLPNVIALLSWFAGGILLGLIEVIALPSDPVYSTLLQLLPLLFLGVESGSSCPSIRTYGLVTIEHPNA